MMVKSSYQIYYGYLNFLGCIIRRTSDEKAYLDCPLSPKKYGFICVTGLTWKFRYALTPEVRRIPIQFCFFERKNTRIVL